MAHTLLTGPGQRERQRKRKRGREREKKKWERDNGREGKRWREM
jgi:hypothetical protein